MTASEAKRGEGGAKATAAGAGAGEGGVIRLESGLIAKYNQPAPRYTSYPTALKFRSIDDAASREALLADLEEARGPLSLYFHLPFCRSLCWFCGCAKVISTQTELADRYLDYLEKEVALYRSLLREGRRVVQLHFGGGTPNFLSVAQIDRLGALIHRNFDFAEGAEVSVEIDPRSFSRAQAQAFRRLGVNRASLGVQDVNPLVQKAVHRVQPAGMNRKAIDWLREAGVGSLNIDLIYGLPYQTEESFRQTLDEVLNYDPDRLAIFSYAHVPWSKPAQKILEKAQLPDAPSKISILVMIVELLSQRGFAHIGMDHFAKRSDPIALAQSSKTLQRNFQGYSLHADVEICAFGMSAISQSGGAYRQNVKDLGEYYRRLDEGSVPLERGYLLTPDDRIRRETIMRLMCDLELDFAERGRASGIDFATYFEAELASLKPMEEDGLLCRTDQALVVTDIGRLLIRNVAARFDAYLGAAPVGYSKAI